jgi:cell wall-associated NlpC family hydrolase
MDRRRTLLRIVTVLAVAGAAAAFAAAPARARTYGDVPKSHWARAYIDAVTDRSAAGQRLLDDYGASFKPERAITRELLARTLVLASGHYGETVKPVAIKDVPSDYRSSAVIQMAVHLGYLTLNKSGDFRPTEPVRAVSAEAAIVRWLRGRYSTSDWTLLSSLRPSRWQPNDGWKTGAPSYLAYVVASRQLQLRYNHASDADGHEVTPSEPVDRAEVAYMIYRAYQVAGDWTLSGLADYRSVSFPVLSDRQKQVVTYALKYIGYPYIWGGEYPTKDSPYGAQKAGGFDCSGFVFYVMKMHFDYPITVNERGGHDMAERAKPRITRKQLQCGDLIFFGPKGPKSDVESIYHVGLYLGDGWFIHSTGSTDGVTLNSLDSPTSTYYKTYFAWGRRLLKPSELPADVAQNAPEPGVQASPEPAAD